MPKGKNTTKSSLKQSVPQKSDPVQTTDKSLVFIYGSAPAGKHFFVADGKVVKDLRELVHALEQMSDDVFYHHVNDARNDFSNWLTDVMKEETLAKELKGTRGRMDTAVKILKHVVGKLEKKVKNHSKK